MREHFALPTTHAYIEEQVFKLLLRSRVNTYNPSEAPIIHYFMAKILTKSPVTRKGFRRQKVKQTPHFSGIVDKPRTRHNMLVIRLELLDVTCPTSCPLLDPVSFVKHYEVPFSFKHSF